MNIQCLRYVGIQIDYPILKYKTDTRISADAIRNILMLCTGRVSEKCR